MIFIKSIRKLYSLILLLVLLNTSALAQSLSEFPVYFLSSSFNTFMLSHEIRNTDSCKINISSYTRKNTGLFKDVYQTNTQIGTHIKNASISLQLYSDKQGELISRNRMYAHYNNSITLSKNTNAFLGISLGIVNKSLGSSNTDVEGSANVFDASTVVGVYTKKFLFLFSALQIPQKTIMPINYEVPLLRYYQIHGIYSSDLSGNFKNQVIGVYNILGNNQSEIIIGDEVTWDNKYKFGIEISNQNSINYFIDFAIDFTPKVNSSILLSYETAHNLSKSNMSSFAIFNVGFKIKIK